MSENEFVFLLIGFGVGLLVAAWLSKGERPDHTGEILRELREPLWKIEYPKKRKRGE